MASIKLYPYKFYVEERQGEGVLTDRLVEFSNKNVVKGKKKKLDLGSLLYDYFTNDLNNSFDDKAKERKLSNSKPGTTTINIQREYIKNGKIIQGEKIYGVLYFGKYGITSTISDEKLKKVNHNKTKKEVETFPLYFNITIEYNRTEGICIFESYSRDSLRGIIENYLNTKLTSINNKYKIRFENYAPKEAVTEQITKGDLKSVRTITYNKYAGKEDKLIDNSGVVAREIETEYVIENYLSVEKIFRIAPKAKERITELVLRGIAGEVNIATVIGLKDDEEFDIIKFDYEIDKVKKTLDIEKETKFRCSRDISKIKLGKDDHPEFSIIHAESEEMANEFSEYIGIVRKY